MQIGNILLSFIWSVVYWHLILNVWIGCAHLNIITQSVIISYFLTGLALSIDLAEYDRDSGVNELIHRAKKTPVSFCLALSVTSMFWVLMLVRFFGVPRGPKPSSTM